MSPQRSPSSRPPEMLVNGPPPCSFVSITLIIPSFISNSLGLLPRTLKRLSLSQPGFLRLFDVLSVRVLLHSSLILSLAALAPCRSLVVPDCTHQSLHEATLKEPQNIRTTLHHFLSGSSSRYPSMALSNTSRERLVEYFHLPPSTSSIWTRSSTESRSRTSLHVELEIRAHHLHSLRPLPSTCVRRASGRARLRLTSSRLFHSFRRRLEPLQSSTSTPSPFYAGMRDIYLDSRPSRIIPHNILYLDHAPPASACLGPQRHVLSATLKCAFARIGCPSVRTRSALVPSL